MGRGRGAVAAPERKRQDCAVTRRWPAARNLDDLFSGVGEMDENRLRVEMVALESDAGEDLRDGEFGVVGVGGEHANGAVEGVDAGEESELAVKAVGEPFAETGGVNGPAVIAGEAVGDDGPGVAEGGGEWGRETEGMIEDLFGAGGVHCFLVREFRRSTFDVRYVVSLSCSDGGGSRWEKYWNACLGRDECRGLSPGSGWASA